MVKMIGTLNGIEIAEIIGFYDDVVVLRLVGQDFDTVCQTKEIEVRSEEF